jgi:hypothetical protein
MWGKQIKLAAIAVTVAIAPGTASATTGTATATIATLRPLTLIQTDDLSFGSLIPSATGGTVKIDPGTDARTTTGGVSTAGGIASAARFAAAGLYNIIGFITLPTSITLTRAGGGGTMTVNNVTTNGPTTRLFAGTVLDVRVGGTLAVAANQAAGAYSGDFNVTVAYF